MLFRSLIQVALEHVEHTALSNLLRGHQREAHAADLARGVQLVERRLAELQRLGIVPTLLGAGGRSGGRHGPSYVTAPSTNQLGVEKKRPPPTRAKAPSDGPSPGRRRGWSVTSVGESARALSFPRRVRSVEHPASVPGALPAAAAP